MREKLETLGVWVFVILTIIFYWLPLRLIEEIKAHRNEIIVLVLGLIIFIGYWKFRIDGSPFRARQSQTHYTYYFPMFFARPNKSGAISATCGEQSELGTSWSYNYSVQGQACDKSFTPMIWGESFVEYPVADSEWLLGFNEPEMANQANLTPEQAATLWRRIETLHPDKKLVSPATLTGLHTTDWLQRFYQSYLNQYGEPPRLDALAIHWYGWDAQNAIDSMNAIIEQARAWNISQVWLTEFAFLASSDTDLCWGHSQSQESAEAQRFLNWLDNEPMITRYAWFAPKIDPTAWWALQPPQCNSPLFDYDSDNLTLYGKLYQKGVAIQ